MSSSKPDKPLKTYAYPFRGLLEMRMYDAVRAAMQETFTKVDQAEICRSCLNCDHFTEKTEACNISDNQRPPARIIAFGCGKWSNIDDDIPF